MIFYGPIKIGTYLGIGLSVPIHHKELLIGVDKFGHFLDERYYYYTLVQQWNYSIDNILDIGTFSENYIEGKLAGEVFSYADLAANFDGYYFWPDLFGNMDSPQSSKYFSCKNSEFKLVNEIDFSLYISPAWDEGMNCNEYRSDSMREEINKSIIGLNARDQKGYQCPVFPEKVQDMIKKYGKYAKKIINPVLFTKDALK